MFSRIFKSLSAWHRRNVDRRHLQELSDRSLADIGLSRGDIEAAIHGKMSVPSGARDHAIVFYPATLGTPTIDGQTPIANEAANHSIAGSGLSMRRAA